MDKTLDWIKSGKGLPPINPNPEYTPPMIPRCKPPCKHRIEIMLVNDNVYDVHLDGHWLFSRTSYENVLTELEKLFTIFDGEEY